jgi:predicted DNA-binding transcriptional regulator YafY
LVELLLLLQLRGRASAQELATALEVSVRTIYRDVQALSAAGVPVYTEMGRHGGVRLQEGYRVGGLPHLGESDARSVLLAAVPAVARDLGLDPGVAEHTVLSAMDTGAAAAARSVRDRLLVEPDDWFRPRQEVPYLLTVARGVWEARELRITYRSASRPAGEHTVRPLGLVLKGDTWYLLARTRRGADRVFRVSRIGEASLLPHRFERPADYDLEVAWAERKREFIASIPRYDVTVAVEPAGESLLGLLQEGTPPLPLAADTPRDERGRARLRLRFERPDSAARLLLQLGGHVEVLGPPEMRELMAGAVDELSRLYLTPTG